MKKNEDAAMKKRMEITDFAFLWQLFCVKLSMRLTAYFYSDNGVDTLK